MGGFFIKRGSVCVKKTEILSKKSIKSKVLARWQLYLWLLIPVIYILVFNYYPMTGIQLAFKKFNAVDGIWGSEWIGLENFRRFFKSYYFERVMTNTLRVSFYTLIVGFPIPIAFALMLNTLRNQKYKKFQITDLGCVRL